MTKTQVIRVRLSETDLAALDAAAERDGLDRSKLIRRAVRAHTGEAYFTEADATLMTAAIAELTALGRNLMMAVRQMNRRLKSGDPEADTRDHYGRDEFDALRHAIDQLKGQLREAVHRRHTQERKP